MKAANIGLLAIVIAALAGAGFFTYFSQDREAQSTGLATRPVLIPAPREGSRELSGLPPAQLVERNSIPPSLPEEPTPAPAPGVESPVDASIKTIPVSHEFEAIFTKYSSFARLHAELEQQPLDLDWAPATEEAFRNHLQGIPELSRYGIFPEVDCRTSLCELRLVAYGADKGTDWSQVLLQVNQGQQQRGTFHWVEGGIPLVTWEEQDGATAIVIQTRFPKRPDSKVN